MKGLISLLLAVLMIFGFAVPVLAIADPDSAPSINAVYVYEDLLEDGDAGVLVDYYLDYAVTPNETATEAYMAVFIDTDGTTQLKAAAPYTFQTSGYGRGLIWLYFTAAEVTSYNITSASEALYSVWLVGNPTLTWVPGPDPPKTTAGIDYWQPVGSSAATLLALRVLYYADILELLWSLDLIENTALGSRLTTLGESYFENVITNLRLMAPSAFSSGESDPTLEDLDYSTAFGATVSNGTGNVTGSPVTLASGENTVTANSTGTIIVTLTQGTSGTAANLTGVIFGSPLDLTWGTNTVNVTSNGTVNITVSLINTASVLGDTVTGTGFDLTTVAARFGMSRWMFSGLIWILLSVVICAALYTRIDKGQASYYAQNKGGLVLLVFDICIVGGAVLGLVHPLVAALLFIAFGAFTGYILFFRGANV